MVITMLAEKPVHVSLDSSSALQKAEAIRENEEARDNTELFDEDGTMRLG